MGSSLTIRSFLLLVLSAQHALADTQSLFTSLDRDQNGLLLADEIDSQHRRLFDRLLRTADSDQDGQLSSYEFQAGLEPKQSAKPLAKKQGSEHPGSNALLLLLAKMDVNANGLIEAEEVPQQFRQLFDRIEERLGGDPDGVLDRRELTYAAPKLSQLALRMANQMDLDVDVELALLPEEQWRSVQKLVGPQRRGELLADPKRALELFNRLDADGDGYVTSEEVPGGIADRFDQLLERADRNRDDKLSEQELMAMSRIMKRLEGKPTAAADLQKGIKRLLKQLDRDGDGVVSRKEAPRRMAGRFDQLDKDGNGKLDREELAIVVKVLSRLRQPEAKLPSSSEPMMQAE